MHHWNDLLAWTTHARRQPSVAASASSDCLEHLLALLFVAQQTIVQSAVGVVIRLVQGCYTDAETGALGVLGVDSQTAKKTNDWCLAQTADFTLYFTSICALVVSRMSHPGSVCGNRT